MEQEEQLKKTFDLFIKFIFGKDVNLDFSIEKHRSVKDGYVILLPRKSSELNHIVGRGGQTLSAINKVFGVWGYRNNIFVVIKQKRDEQGIGNENSSEGL